MKILLLFSIVALSLGHPLDEVSSFNIESQQSPVSQGETYIGATPNEKKIDKRGIIGGWPLATYGFGLPWYGGGYSGLGYGHGYGGLGGWGGIGHGYYGGLHGWPIILPTYSHGYSHGWNRKW